MLLFCPLRMKSPIVLLLLPLTSNVQPTSNRLGLLRATGCIKVVHFNFVAANHLIVFKTDSYVYI